MNRINNYIASIPARNVQIMLLITTTLWAMGVMFILARM